MRVWIDAEPTSQSPTIFGLTPLERILRSLAKLVNRPVEVVVSCSGAIAEGHGYRVMRETGPAGKRLAEYLSSGKDAVLVLDGGAVVDHRLLPLLMDDDKGICLKSGTGLKETAVLKLAPHNSPPSDATSVPAIATKMLAEGDVQEINASDLPNFVVNLRRNVPFTLERIADEKDRASLERRMFLMNYKGSTDFMTKWVYPPLVWQCVKFCVRWNVHPNTVTVASILLAIAAVPLFAQSYWLIGFLAAYGMSVLDSVDGKVARVTLTDSPIGNVLDHGLDIVHPPFWYAAWALGLGASTAGGPLYSALWWLVFFYVADRLVLMVAKKRFKRGLHAVTTLDGTARTFIARRNVNLVVMTIGIMVGLGEQAFYFITIWQGLTFCWHSIRTVWLFPRSRFERYLV